MKVKLMTLKDKNLQQLKYPASELREYCYPALGQQFDALYKARLGDNTMQTKIDAHIKFVKDNIAMDDKEYTFEEMTEIKKGFVSDPAFIAEYVGLERTRLEICDKCQSIIKYKTMQDLWLYYAFKSTHSCLTLSY